MAKILIVDDNATNRKLLVSLLQHEGHEMMEAVDGKDALAALRAQRPQLVMSDILMPTMDGYEFVRQVRADPELAGTPIIFQTAHYGEREAQRLAQVCGVSRVLAKPSESIEILRAVAQALAGASVPLPPPLSADFDREHLQLITNKLSASSDELRAANRENGSLYREVEHHAAELLIEMEKRERATANLRASETRFRQLAENIQDVFFLMSPDFSQTFYLSPAYEQIWGRPRGSVYADSMAWADSIHPDDAERIRSNARRALSAEPTNNTVEFRIVRPDKSVRWILARTFAIPAEDSTVARIAGVATDITDRKEAEARIQHLNRVYAVASGINSLLLRVQNRHQLLDQACRLAVEKGQFRFAWCGWLDSDGGEFRDTAWAGDNANFALLLHENIGSAASRENVIGPTLASRQPQICNDIQNDALLEPCRDELVSARLSGPRGSTVDHCRRAYRLPGAGNGGACGFFDATEMCLLVELAGDISFALDYIEKAEKLNYLAYYDVLTGLANRTLFHERLSMHVNTAARGETKLALAIVQIDRFETISDTLGRHAADQLFREAAQRFVRCVGHPEDVARIGPDQFAAVISDIARESDVVLGIEEWWSEWLNSPFEVDDNELRLSANAGVALFPIDGSDADTLLRHAQAALKKAKATGDPYLFYTRHLGERGSANLALENKLRRALENEEFVLHYQPKVDLETRRMKGVEALIRWQDPQTGLMPPAQFIPLMEETGIIADVGAWVLRQACLDRSRWLERELNAPRVAINVSTVQLRRKDVVQMVKDALGGAGNEAGIDIEVTESLIMQDVVDNIAKLVAIRDLGVHIAIDDFGTGYSSLGYLAKLPVETLKIDRSFINSMLDDPSAMTLVSTIISLAHSLRLEVVAEGVESEEQAKILRLVRCDQMQGYLISKPLSFDDMTAYLGSSQTSRAAVEPHAALPT